MPTKPTAQAIRSETQHKPPLRRCSCSPFRRASTTTSRINNPEPCSGSEACQNIDVWDAPQTATEQPLSLRSHIRRPQQTECTAGSAHSRLPRGKPFEPHTFDFATHQRLKGTQGDKLRGGESHSSTCKKGHMLICLSPEDLSKRNLARTNCSVSAAQKQAQTRVALGLPRGCPPHAPSHLPFHGRDRTRCTRIRSERANAPVALQL